MEQSKVYNNLIKEYHNDSKADIFSIAFFGRLTKIKKVDLLINALVNLNEKNIKYQLKILGDGPEKANLKKLVGLKKAEKYITFQSGTYDENELGKLLIQSDLLVSPGNVGLNAVHALCYGTPVLTHNNFKNQMPEHEAIVESFNGIFHNENDINSIEEKIQYWFSNFHNLYSRQEMRDNILKKYRPDNQVKIFETSLK